MAGDDKRFREYYVTNAYKGFQKVRANNYKVITSSTHLTFSNGQREIFASGHFKKDALKNIFDKIDDFHNN